MIKITADIFSGRSNPEWIIDGDEAKAILREVALNKSAISPTNPNVIRLGYRGLVVELLSDDTATQYELPGRFRLGGGEAAHESKSREIAERAIRALASSVHFQADIEAGTEERASLMSLLLEEMSAGSLERGPRGITVASAIGIPVDSAASPTPSCTVETTPYNPNFWNQDSSVQLSNNCYNYATNRRTNTFARPGRASGHQVVPIFTADNVTQAALRDGAHIHTNCCPDSEKPRWLIALVIAPPKQGDPNWNDFHWYRRNADGYWGQKAGQNPVVNYDDDCMLIKSPEHCNRGKYTQFCGYFYSPKSMKVS